MTQIGPMGCHFVCPEVLQENLEIQAGMAIIDRMGEPFDKNELKTEPYNKKLKIEPKPSPLSHKQKDNHRVYRVVFD